MLTSKPIPKPIQPSCKWDLNKEKNLTYSKEKPSLTHEVIITKHSLTPTKSISVHIPVGHYSTQAATVCYTTKIPTWPAANDGKSFLTHINSMTSFISQTNTKNRRQ